MKPGILCLLLAATATAQTPLVAPDATWTFLDDGSEPPATWREPGFEDATWRAGPGSFGYGDMAIRTRVRFGPKKNDKHITTYFRHTFHIEDLSSHRILEMKLRRDDGVILYLNGREIWRDNMPAGAVNAHTRAASSIGGSQETLLHTKRIPARDGLRTGINTLAAEVHQHLPTSSDLRFEFALDSWSDEPPVRVVRGPYLQSGTPNGVVVRWRTELPTESQVQAGTDPGSLDLRFASPGRTTEHEVVVRGLLPDTTYHYTIGDGRQHAWTTSPVPGSPATSRIWILGDSGRPGELLTSVRDSFYTWHGSAAPDLWLMLGDNAYNDGTDEEHQAAVFDVFPQTLATTVLWPTLGNHEGHSCSSPLGLGPYYEIFTLPRKAEAGGLPSGTEAYYSFDYANIHFVCLNSFDIDRSPGGAMYHWLKADLAAASRHWTIAFWHHPPYSKGSHDSDVEIELVEMREIFLPLLEQAGVDLVLTGHSHAYERSFLVDGHYGHSGTLTSAMKIDHGDGRPAGDGPYDKSASGGAVYTVAGCSSSPGGGTFDHPVKVVSVSQLGSLVLDVSPDQIDATYLDHQANAFDQFRIAKQRR